MCQSKCGRLLALREAASRLARDDRELIRLRYVEGLTEAAIAEKLGISQDRKSVV